MKRKLITICFFFIASAAFSQRYYLKSALGYSFALPGESVTVTEANIARKTITNKVEKLNQAGGYRVNIGIGARLNDDFALEFSYAYQRSPTQTIFHENLYENNDNYYVIKNHFDFFSYMHKVNVSLRVDKSLGEKYTIAFLAGPVIFRGNIVERAYSSGNFYYRSDMSSKYTFGAQSGLLLERHLGPVSIYCESLLDVNYFVPKRKRFLRPRNKYDDIYFDKEEIELVTESGNFPLNYNSQLEVPLSFVAVSVNLGIRYNFY